MDCKEEACLECTKQCLLLHKKKKRPIPNISSFFKVMIGDKFSEILFLPPKFARTVSALVDEKTHLEDSSGRQWEITVSNLNGSLAFHQGWHAFALDHRLEIGDFVVFHYIMGSHFITQIYDRTGCEKPKYSENGQHKKITRNKRSPISKDRAFRTIDKGSINEQVSSTSVLSGSDIGIIQSQCDATDVEKVPMIVENTSNCKNSNGKLKSVCKAEYVEEPYYIIDRDLGYKRGEYRSSIFDLSNFEMQNNEFGADGSKKIVAGVEKSPHHADKLLISQTEAMVADVYTVAEEVGRKVVASDASKFETGKKKDSDVVEKIILRHNKDSCDNKVSGQFLTTSAEEPGENGKDSSDLGNEGIKEHQMAEMKIINTHSKRALELMKGLHHHSWNPTRKDNDEVYEVVKTEAVDFIGSPLPIAANLSCIVGTDDRSFLELPASLPSFSYRGRTKMERKVVVLQDPDKKSWPVLYHERQGFKALTSGWEDFSRANNIQPGDECVFTLENELKGIYAVRIVQK
ncbi:uncharacterized protein LOC104882266 isoform X2 [Vitis vinifera]|uniref:uncharacterized protein LOC104882266 isoform X2 n=1 Tax=Vitis vinifera TaxID=29760 RepID=UPI00053FA50D|nr:uncharacterized protein LOC104882266 isoform X2 [Vitis vinifera]|eukprot:XP_010663044.1 PREDICTED: uncharacterized protein LOC104882266 isoform X2 [Vitis vinifera]